MGGRVVHARRGDRASYRPIDSALCAGSSPLEIAGALLGLFPFTTLYLADLDAIQRRGDNAASIEALHRRFPRLELWVDSGIAGSAAYAAAQARGIAHAVIGSEAMPESALLLSLCGQEQKRFPVLSLDFRDDGFIGPPALLESPRLWPRHVIAMTLARVGGERGPDFDRVSALLKQAPDKRIYAAGGVRSIDDLEELARRKASGALIASALHDGRITAKALQAFASVVP